MTATTRPAVGQFPISSNLYGVYAGRELLFLVEAASQEEAAGRVAKTAPLFGIPPSATSRIASVGGHPDEVPTFLNAFFEAQNREPELTSPPDVALH